MPRINSSSWKSGDLRIHSGTLDDIPNGWELASEMVDRAVVGAGGAYSKGQAFGADSRTPSISVDNHTLSSSRVPAKNYSYGVTGSTGGTIALYRISSVHGTTNIGGSGGAHAHGASASAVDTRQKSIAVIWIRKL